MSESTRRRWLKVAAVIFAVIVVLGVVRYIAAPAFIGAPDAVHVVVAEVEPASPKTTVIFDQRFAQQATAVFQQILAAGPPNGVSSCWVSARNALYYHYSLTFTHLGLTVATATSDAKDCMSIELRYPDGSVDSYPWMTSDHASFWIRLRSLVNAPEPIGACIGIDASGICDSAPTS